MFVLEALVLTFITTPVVTWLYPPQFRRRITATGVPFDHVADDEGAAHKRPALEEGEFRTRFTVVLDKLEHLPGMMALTQLVQPIPVPQRAQREKESEDRRLSITHSESSSISSILAEAFRVIELSDRVSAVMRSSNAEQLLHTDPLLSIFRMFGQLNNIRVSPAVSVAKFDDLAYSVAEHARNHDSDMIFIPWLPPMQDIIPLDANPAPSTPLEQPIALASGALSPPHMSVPIKSGGSHNPFELLFKASKSAGAGTPGGPVDISNNVAITHSQFVRGVFSQSTTDVALFVDQSTLDSSFSSSIVGGGFGMDETGYHQHVFLPFFGGPDDRLALEFVVQICANPRIKGTVIRIYKTEELGGLPTAGPGVAGDATPTKPTTAHIEHGLLGQGAIEELNRLTVTSVSIFQLLFNIRLLMPDVACWWCTRYFLWPAQHGNPSSV